MILSEFIRIVDISWEEFLWMAFWFSAIFMIIGVIIWSSAWILSRQTFIKNVLPKKMDGLIERKDKKIKELSFELAKVTLERDRYHNQLLVIKNSSEVRGIK